MLEEDQGSELEGRFQVKVLAISDDAINNRERGTVVNVINDDISSEVIWLIGKLNSVNRALL